jgi:putative tryptophan/tyrosine transport system substrate-binding protein
MGRYRVRGTALLVVLTVLLVLPLLAVAQRPEQVRRIAFLGFGPPPSAAAPDPFVEAFRQALLARGWTEGHNLAIEWRWAEGALDHFATLVAEVIGLRVEVIVVPNAATAQIAKKATTTIPIVVVGAGNLVESGLAASLAQPGGNITGVTTLGPELYPKRLRLLKEALPGVTRVAVLRGLADFEPAWHAMEGAARSLGVELQLFEVRESTAFDSAFAAITRAQANALLVLGDPFFFPYRQRIADLATQQYLPSICGGRRYAEAGCLMSYGSNQRDRGPQIATYVDKILKGAKPGDLPVEQPMKFEFVINLKTAEALGLTIPPILLFQADEVIR